MNFKVWKAVSVKNLPHLIIHYLVSALAYVCSHTILTLMNTRTSLSANIFTNKRKIK